jgi:Tol biopolymer transport system component
MKTMSRLALFLFGIALLGMVGAMDLARGEAVDSQWVIFVSDETLYVVPTTGGETVTVGVAHGGYRPFYELNSDGIWHYYINDDDWYRVRPIYPRPQRPPQMEGRSWFMAMSPNAEWLLFQSEVSAEYGDLHRISADGKVLETLTNSDAYHRFITLSPDKTWIYYSLYDNGIDDLYRMRWDGSERHLIATEIDFLRFLGWSQPDNHMIVGETISGELTIVLLNVDNGNRTLLIDDLERGLPQVSDDGEWIVYRQAGALDLILMRSDGSNGRMVVGGMDQYIVDWTPDGKRLVLGNFIDGTESSVLDIETGQINRVVLPADGINPYLSRWIPHSNCLVYDRIWDADYTIHSEVTCIDTGQTYHFSMTDGRSAEVVGWSMDGTWGVFNVWSEYRAALYRMSFDGATNQRISPYFGNISGASLSAVIEREWDAQHLVIIGLIVIGGGLCGSYWFSRE